jgi:hypothetical protein
MYEIMRLNDRLAELKEVCKRGEGNKAIYEEIFEIEMRLDNILYIDY